MQVTPSAQNRHPNRWLLPPPADSPKSAPAPEPSPVPPEFPAPRRAAEHAFGNNALFTATSAIDSPGYPPLRGFGRIPVHNVRPEVESGHLPIYSVVNEEFEVTANVFREGHDAVGASVVLTDPEGNRHLTDMHQSSPGD
ncbi:alpha-amylase [Cutibacterium acnes JCM 18918]|nr:alpha-amylase [Cutibacterium acnes JCM 18918]